MHGLSLPELKLKIQYQDIGGKSYNHSYHVKPAYHVVIGTKVAEKPSVAFIGSFEIS